MRLTHDAQVMPSIGSWISAVGGRGSVGRHTPREYTSRAGSLAADVGTLGAMPPLEIAIADASPAARRRSRRRHGARRRRGRAGPTDRGRVLERALRRRRRARSMLDARRRRRPTVLAARRRPVLEALLAGEPARRRRPSRSTWPTGRDFDQARARRGPRRSAGARPRATATSPAGSGRRARRGPSAARSAATRSRCSSRATGSSPPTARSAATAATAGSTATDAARAQGGAAAARRHHGRRDAPARLRAEPVAALPDPGHRATDGAATAPLEVR